MTEAEVAWVAGVFEGEGSISFVGKQGVNVRVNMTDHDIIWRLHETTGLGHVSGPYPGTNKLKWVWYVGEKTEARDVLQAMCPWLGKRRLERAFEAIDRLAQPRTRALKPVEHGTTRGYQAELRRGLPRCAACLTAQNERNVPRAQRP